MNEEGTRCMRPTGDGEEGAEGDCKGRVTGQDSCRLLSSVTPSGRGRVCGLHRHVK